MKGLAVLQFYLLLPLVVGGEYPDFDDDYDGHSWYECEEDACYGKTMYLYMNNEIPVPNKTVKYFTYDYFDVDTVGLLADCAPSVTVADIAYSFKSCKDKEIDWKYRDACLFRRKGWVGQDGKTINSSLSTAFGEIDGASENIEKCLKWDGVWDDDYYDFYDYDDDYDYWYLEEIDTKDVRNKRDLNESIPDFLKNRNERSITQKEKRKFQEKTKKIKRGGKQKNNYGKKSNKKNSVIESIRMKKEQRKSFERIRLRKLGKSTGKEIQMIKDIKLGGKTIKTRKIKIQRIRAKRKRRKRKRKKKGKF